MSHEKSWTFSLNTAPNDLSSLDAVARAYMWQDTQFLINSGGWAIDSANNWGSQAALTWAASGSAHSWIVLKKSGIVAGTSYDYGANSMMYKSYDLNNANPYRATFAYHIDQPTGGTSTAAPTSTQQIQWAAQQFLRSTLSANTLFHFGVTSEGAHYSKIGYSGTGYVPFGLTLFPTSSPQTVKTNSNNPIPWATAAAVAFADSGVGAFTLSNISSSASLKGWAYDGTAVADNTLYLGGGAIFSGTLSGSAFGYLMPSNGGILNNEHLRSGMFLFCGKNGKASFVANIADFKLSAQATAQGNADVETDMWCKLGNLWVPKPVGVQINI